MTLEMSWDVLSLSVSRTLSNSDFILIVTRYTHHKTNKAPCGVFFMLVVVNGRVLLVYICWYQMDTNVLVFGKLLCVLGTVPPVSVARVVYHCTDRKM